VATTDVAKKVENSADKESAETPKDTHKQA
jgi:hypothetical protein